jgi:hypothetical protein
MTPMTRASRAVLSVAAVGAATLAYALWEARQYTLRRATVPVLPAGSASLRLLHLSDLHLTPEQRAKRAWVHSLMEVKPDAVIITGDFLAHRDAVPAVLDALGPLLDLPGAFVLGSNDYFAPRGANPLRYLKGPSSVDTNREQLPWPDLVAGLISAGWRDLDNARSQIELGGLRIDLRGVDDPHIGRDAYADVQGPIDPRADLSVGVAHAPYRRVLDAMAADGVELILAGHTHGGQVCLPGFGALVTNCDLERSRAKGLSRHPVGRDASWLHVSAGVGTSPYAPVRLACPPEATVLTLTAGG